MRKIALRFFIAYLTVAATLRAEESIQRTSARPKQPLDVYLLIGQSNMAGRAHYEKDEAGPIDRCYLLNEKDQWEPAKNPLNRHSTIRKDLKFQKLGPGDDAPKVETKLDPATNHRSHDFKIDPRQSAFHQMISS